MSKWEYTIRTFEGQQFEALRYECRKERKLFEDPFFPARAESLATNYRTVLPNWREIGWKRPGEIVDDPQLIVNGIKRTDPNQGDLGDCWFIAAMSALTQNSTVLKRVIPSDQSFHPDWYAGIFHFRFWRYQQWYDIVVDDRLPYLLKQKRLWAAQNLFEINEFWVPLLEKAYAKLNGSYINLAGGLPVNALTDFTGGIEQRFEFKSNVSRTHLRSEDLFDFIKSCLDYGSLIACSINADHRKQETILANGLVIGHTYSITNYHILSPSINETKLSRMSDRGLIRFRNPWGNAVEWNGQWSDADPLWNSLDEDTRKRLSIRREHDGEFWMTFRDFYREFDVMEVCHLSPDTYDDFGLTRYDHKHHWRTWYVRGSWRAGENSGGSCANSGCRHGCYYWRNPQFVVELTLNRSFNAKPLCMMIIALMQKPLTNNAAEQYIQIRLFKIKAHVKIEEKKVFKPEEVERIASTGPYVNRREVSLLLKTTNGVYLIVPSMADVDQNCDFLLRIFSQDTTLGRTFINLFANERSISEPTPMNVFVQRRKTSTFFFSLLITGFDHQCFALIPVKNNNIECRLTDIQLYTWSGSSFQSGECWYQGQRFVSGATWGRTDVPGSPYCICEQGRVRIFYSQKPSIAADALTILPPPKGFLPTSNELAKWPIPNFPRVRQRMVFCSFNRTGLRVRSRDGCITCKCTNHGHWLCRKASAKSIQPTESSSASTFLDTYHVHLHITTTEAPQRSLYAPQYCILIERLRTANESSSRYIEIPHQTSWIDRDACTRCSCLSNGTIECQFLHQSCARPCLLHKTGPVSVMYYFPSGSTWLTSRNDPCRSCTCTNGERTCLPCDQILRINIDTQKNEQGSKSIGDYRAMWRPCLLQTSASSHRLVFPGQRISFEQRCYFCSQHNSRLLRC